MIGPWREKNMANPILVTGAAGRVGAVKRTVTERCVRWCEMKTNARRRCETRARRSWSVICSISLR